MTQRTRDPAQVFVNALREVGLDVDGVTFFPDRPPPDRMIWTYSPSFYEDEHTERMLHRAVCIALPDQENVCYDCFSANGGLDYGQGHCLGFRCSCCTGCKEDE